MSKDRGLNYKSLPMPKGGGITEVSMKEKQIKFSFRLPERIHELLGKDAHTNRRTINQQLLTIVTEYLESQGIKIDDKPPIESTPPNL